MATIHTNIEQQLPYLTILKYGNAEYIGIVFNYDSVVTSFYDLGEITDTKLRNEILEIGETWWWESDRSIPISIFCRERIRKFQFAIKHFGSKDVDILVGPVASLSNPSTKKLKRKVTQFNYKC